MTDRFDFVERPVPKSSIAIRTPSSLSLAAGIPECRCGPSYRRYRRRSGASRDRRIHRIAGGQSRCAAKCSGIGGGLVLPVLIERCRYLSSERASADKRGQLNTELDGNAALA
jgi:hypothetical protein